MPERPAASVDAQYAALSATSEAQFREVFRRLKDVEDTSGEARDNTKEIIATLKAQNALARIEEVKSEVTAKVEALRQDVVHANTEARKHLDAKMIEVDLRLEPLEGQRDRNAGAAMAVRVAFDILKFIVGGSLGALLMKLAQAG